MKTHHTRRSFICQSSALLAAGFALRPHTNLLAADAPPEGFRSLFDGKTIAGWHAMPRALANKERRADAPSDPNSQYERALRSRGKWTVQDGILIGEQDPPASGFGGYLVSDETFGDFELLIDAKPNWAVDTGVLVRTTPLGNVGIQVLIDHRKSGGIGGFYGNGLAGFHAVPYQFNAIFDKDGRPIGLQEEDPKTTIESGSEAKRRLLSYAAPVGEFLKAWKSATGTRSKSAARANCRNSRRGSTEPKSARWTRRRSSGRNLIRRKCSRRSAAADISRGRFTAMARPIRSARIAGRPARSAAGARFSSRNFDAMKGINATAGAMRIMTLICAGSRRRIRVNRIRRKCCTGSPTCICNTPTVAV